MLTLHHAASFTSRVGQLSSNVRRRNMHLPPSPLQIARAELVRSNDLSDYEAVDVAWVSMIKAANTRPEQNEHKRLVALLDMADAEVVRLVLHLPQVDVLLNLTPPLESLLTSRHERLDLERTTDEMNDVRQSRHHDPKAALRSLAEILKRIRNRRAHGFKTPFAPRDQEILGAAAPVLRAMAKASIDAADA